MILSRGLYSQDTNYIPTSKEVLKYLYNQSVKAKYLEKALVINDSIILNQMDVIEVKDSIIVNRNDQIAVCEENVGMLEIIEKGQSNIIKN